MNVLTVAMTAGVMILTAGCSTAPKPAAATIKSDVKFTEEISATVTADQKIVLDGKKFEVADVPKQLALRNASKEITIIVYPESEMTRETLIDMIKALIKNNYFVTVGANSKYADVPIPGRS